MAATATPPVVEPQPPAQLTTARRSGVFSRELVVAAVRDSFPKLDPRLQLKNPVMFIVELGSVITTLIFFLELARGHYDQLWFVGVIAFWLWLTVLFANFAEAVAEGRGKAQADALRATRTTTTSPRWSSGAGTSSRWPSFLRRRAFVVVRVVRRASAWALPRPSATASAKFAKITVNQSQRATFPVNHAGAASGTGATRSRSQTSVESTLPT